MERIECVALSIRPADHQPAEVLSAELIRRVKLGSILREIMRSADPDLVQLGLGPKNGFGRMLGELRGGGFGPLVPQQPGPGRKPKPLAALAEVAEVYLSAPTTPRKAVAVRFSTSESNASKWIRQCRDESLIANTSRGKPSGGEP